MSKIRYYLEGSRQDRINHAVSHTKDMEERFPNEISTAVKETKKYNEHYIFTDFPEANENICVKLLAQDSVQAAFNEADGKTCILNFASFTHPGGMFLTGSRAQEECLCHESFLYNVLKEFDKSDKSSTASYYESNRAKVNRGLYYNRAFYTPNIIFEKDSISANFDVITCAAPNLGPTLRYGLNVSKEENSKVLESRIKFILDIAAENRVDTLILGAFGCGVFKQDASEVANIFIKCISNSHRYFKKVIFAVPSNVHSENFDKFYDVFVNMEGKSN